MKFHNRETHSYTKQHVKQGDKVGVVMDRPHGQVSIKINGVKQGTMFGNLPMRQDLYFVVDLVCVGEAVAMTDVAVRQSWCAFLSPSSVPSQQADTNAQSPTRNVAMVLNTLHA